LEGGGFGSAAVRERKQQQQQQQQYGASTQTVQVWSFLRVARSEPDLVGGWIAFAQPHLHVYGPPGAYAAAQAAAFAASQPAPDAHLRTTLLPAIPAASASAAAAASADASGSGGGSQQQYMSYSQSLMQGQFPEQQQQQPQQQGVSLPVIPQPPSAGLRLLLLSAE
jgi:hypothetical protein